MVKDKQRPKGQLTSPLISPAMRAVSEALLAYCTEDLIAETTFTLLTIAWVETIGDKK